MASCQYKGDLRGYCHFHTSVFNIYNKYSTDTILQPKTPTYCNNLPLTRTIGPGTVLL